MKYKAKLSPIYLISDILQISDNSGTVQDVEVILATMHNLLQFTVLHN